MSEPGQRDESPQRRRRRRWPWVVGTVLLLAALLIGSLPWLLNTPAGNRLVAKHVAQAFAPGRVRFRAIRFSWIGPTRLSEVVLDDPRGKTVVTSPSATLSAGLWGLITRPERPGELSLESSAFDVERREDGSFDLADALEGIFSGRDPLRDLTIRADAASLRFRAPALAEPLSAVSMDLLVQLRPAPAADVWSVDLRRGAGSTLRIRGDVNRWQSSPELGVDVAIGHWPVTAGHDSIVARMSLDGEFSARRVAGRWQSKGSVRADGLHVLGRALQGDEIDLSSVETAWSVAQRGSGGWAVERLEATSAIGRLSAVMPDAIDASHTAKIEGQLDLPSLFRQLPRTLSVEGLSAIESGTARLSAVGASHGDGTEWTLDATIADVAWRGEGPERRHAPPVSVTGRASYHPEARSIDLAKLDLSTHYGAIHGVGRIEELDGPFRFELSGSIEPAWDTVTKLLSERVEPGARLSGEPAPFRLKGTARGPDAWRALELEMGLRLTGADVFGMKLGPTPVSLRARDGRLAVAPIDSTLNEGRIHVEPVVDLEGAGGPVVRLGSESRLTDATVNEHVSRRVLSYVAPVLDQATRASGRVSVEIEEATIPIGGDPARHADVKGKVVFQDVEFAPGPLTREMVALVAPAKQPGTLRLAEPVFLTIADGRVNQRGLAIPIGDVTRVEVEGWVDFQKNLNLVATLPVTPAMFGNRPLLGSIVAGTQIRVPIRGTLDAPKLDKDAFRAGLAELGKGLLARGAGVGALEILERLSRPRDPNAPPTPAERKAQRLDRRNERRRARGLDPLPGPDGPR
jgi:hypothetical protein